MVLHCQHHGRACSTPATVGLGADVIEPTLAGGAVHWYDFILKMVFTCLTLSFGGSGGIVTPIFFIGTTAGGAIGSVLGNAEIFAAIGLVSLLAGAANTPISASIMAAELFGPKVAPYAALACVISFLMTGHRSVYPSQVLAVTKSTSIRSAKGMAMESIADSEIKPRPRSVTYSLIKGYNRAMRVARKRSPRP